MNRVVLDYEKMKKSYEGRRRAAPNVTMVAFYGTQKPQELVDLIELIQYRILRGLESWRKEGWFELVPIERVHATIIGLEAKGANRQGHWDFQNINMRDWAVRNQRSEETPPMKLDELAGFFHCLPFPIQLQFGGFSQKAVNPYDKRPPDERSFSVQDNGLMVGMGWHVREGRIQPTLLGIRQAFQRFNCFHKYELDNDCFFVVGEVCPEAWRNATTADRESFQTDLSKVQKGVREFMAMRRDPFAKLGEEHCRIVRYECANLAEINDLLSLFDVTPEGLESLYNWQPQGQDLASSAAKP